MARKKKEEVVTPEGMEEVVIEKLAAELAPLREKTQEERMSYGQHP